jgi:Holliday junction DNA helicase RuvA
MIGRLRGHPSDEADGSTLIDVGGVGYEVVAPAGTLGRAERADDGTVTLFVHTHVREDAFELYAFASIAERTAFRTLISISKVGPKLALSVLGTVRVEELAQLVETGQVGPLTKIPGVGKKTAERMVLELEGKLSGMRTGALPHGGSPSATAVMQGATGALSQATTVVDALVRMGFKSTEAERAVAGLEDLDRPLGDLIREALAVLSS